LEKEAIFVILRPSKQVNCHDCAELPHSDLVTSADWCHHTERSRFYSDNWTEVGHVACASQCLAGAITTGNPTLMRSKPWYSSAGSRAMAPSIATKLQSITYWEINKRAEKRCPDAVLYWGRSSYRASMCQKSGANQF
jgi:hypothetical protein